MKRPLLYPKPIDEVAGTFSFDETNVAEQTMLTLPIEDRSNVGGIWISMRNVTQDTTIRASHRTNAINDDDFTTLPWLITDDVNVLIGPFTAYRDIQITLQCGGGGAGSVDVPYAVV
jgi:hypothetical protein